MWPPALIVLGLAAGYGVTWLYGRLSDQDLVASLRQAERAMRAELAGYDGAFPGLRWRLGQLLRVHARLLRVISVPALTAGLPVLVLVGVLDWLNPAFWLMLMPPGLVLGALVGRWHLGVR